MKKPISRRTLLGKGAAGAAITAAAVALPSSAQAAIQQPPTPEPTRHYQEALAEYQAAIDRAQAIENELLASGLTPAQRKLWSRWIDEEGARLVAEADLFVEALGVHFRGLSPAFRAISSVSHGDLPFLTCCDYWREG
jgi:hypothetical protein